MVGCCLCCYVFVVSSLARITESWLRGFYSMLPGWRFRFVRFTVQILLSFEQFVTVLATRLETIGALIKRIQILDSVVLSGFLATWLGPMFLVVFMQYGCKNP